MCLDFVVVVVLDYFQVRVCPQQMSTLQVKRIMDVNLSQTPCFFVWLVACLLGWLLAVVVVAVVVVLDS